MIPLARLISGPRSARSPSRASRKVYAGFPPRTNVMISLDKSERLVNETEAGEFV